MIRALKPYAEVKDSGVPWLGQAPAHWEVRRIKYLLSERDSRSLTGTEQLLRVSQYTGVTERKRTDELGGPDTRAASLVGYKRVSPSDLVVNIMLAWNGSMGVSAFEGICSPAYCVYRFGPDAIPMYFHHLLRSPAYLARIKALSRGVVDSRLRLYTDDLFRMEALLPPKGEQAAIVRFLDHADRRIRRAIAAKKKLIRLLEEQKQAIIHRAVTRGLDPNVRLKPSGVEWLGDVPEHWEVVKLSHWFRCTSGSTPSRSGSGYFAGNIPWVKTGELLNDEIHGADEFITREALEHSSLTLLPIDTLLIAMYGQGKTRGRTGLLKIEATINQASLAILPNPARAMPKYLQLWAVSQYTFLRHISEARNATQPNLNAEIIKSLRVVLPPLVEQKRILEVVEAETAAVLGRVVRAKREIGLLGEYRTRLIADVVTGKFDVREAAARLPEAPESELLDDEALDAEDDDEASPDEAIAEDEAA